MGAMMSCERDGGGDKLLGLLEEGKGVVGGCEVEVCKNSY